MSGASTFRWESAGITNVGKVRSINEDALGERPDVGLWVVADGMGGHHAGDLASQSIVNGLQEVPASTQLSRFVDDVEDKLLLVNRSLLQEAAAREGSVTIGSTVVVLLAQKRHCACLWAGDSRAYRLRDGAMQPISRDHSQVEELIAEGVLLREDAESHPAANVITRAVGADESLFVDIQVEKLHDGDRYLLCSDGLFKEVSETEIAGLIKEGNCQDVCDRLIELALERGARDNVTVIVVDFSAVED